eukprot:SRR837773.1598.p1 GENE.SRR837773.1598~~SRR837773.1598.p1  ORF type:complete len:467 (+),score=181.33 SRR837773.1598:58-1401(+)
MEVVESAKSGDGTVHNVGVRMTGSFSCPDCRQKFDTEWAMKTHWRFIHDPSRHQEDEGDGAPDPEAEAERALEALEAALRAAERRAAEAERLYLLASRQVTEPRPPVPEPKVEDFDGTPDKEASEMHHKGHKNAGAMTDRAVRRERWVAKRAREGRVREATKRSRDLLRRAQRDLRFDHGVGADDSAPAPAAPSAQVNGTSKHEPVAPDSAQAKDGAKGIAERLLCIKERENAAEKRMALAKVMTGGRDNYYTFDPSDVLADLKDRCLLDDVTCRALLDIVEGAAPKQGARLHPSEWLAHAQKVSTMQRVDDRPFKEAELAYLQCVEERNLFHAERELAAAEAQLKEVVGRAEALNLPDDDAYYRQVYSEVEVDQDYAEQLEELHHPHKESHGAKNTSALTDKQASCKKWEAAHNKEQRDREHDKKVRDNRRGEARDRKADAANVGA